MRGNSPTNSNSRELFQYCVQILNDHSSGSNQQEIQDQQIDALSYIIQNRFSNPLSQMVYQASFEIYPEVEPEQQEIKVERQCRRKVKSYVEEQDPLFSPSELRLKKKKKVISKNKLKLKVDFDTSKQPCNCSKSFCQKMYCECLARGKLCSIQCKNQLFPIDFEVDARTAKTMNLINYYQMQQIKSSQTILILWVPQEIDSVLEDLKMYWILVSQIFKGLYLPKILMPKKIL